MCASGWRRLFDTLTGLSIMGEPHYLECLNRHTVLDTMG